MSSGYLMGAIAEEKGFRTIEILFTSLSPTQLMGGKIASVVGVSFTQLFAWISLSALLVWLGNNVLGSNLLQNLSLDVASIVPLIIVFFPAYLLFAACMTALGATFAEAQDAQGVMGIFIMLTMIPVWAFQLMSNNPDGPLPVGLTLFPFTALSTLSLRLTFTQVPVWQIVACATILTASAGCAVWFAGRAFRLGMLRYGQNLNLREILRAQSHNRDEHEQNATHRA